MTDKVVIHIGLHKTGTRFLQRMVFGQLDAARFAVNPPDVWDPLRDAVRKPGDGALADRARAAVADWRNRGDGRTLIISEPHICGDMFSSYHDYADNVPLVTELFPQARIIYFVRRPADWLQSAYRQLLARGRSVPIQVFLNYYDGAFRPRLGRWAHGSRNLNALELPFLQIYQAYAEAYGAGRVHLFRQEDLRSQQSLVERRLADVLSLEQLPKPPVERSQNRSYSALAIKWLHPGTTRRFPPPTEEDLGKPDHRFPRLRGKVRRVRRALTQHVFDRVVYRDWDLLAEDGMRGVLEAHYAGQERALAELAAAELRRAGQGETTPMAAT
ncbi:MAG: sulfotransferase [Ectothiorhodospiraceae bacterium]|nr:sulfotransferase [Ectothiorhodospiraceae bacterium]MCH8504957.1 sulfotransferase [Ectothiorhodospiraceae bacterium]